MITTRRDLAPSAFALAETSESLRSRVAGTDVSVPLLSGGTGPYINFDNAASTPPFRRVLRDVNRFAEWYSNVHRGTGWKSRLSTHAFEEARKSVARFIGADSDQDVVFFTRNATEGINHLAGRYPFGPRAVVLTTEMEHHSNELPWRRRAEVVRIRVLDDGALDEDDLRQKLDEYAGRLALLAVTAASNITGVLNPVHRYAEWAHQAGARIVVDAAQLAPHHPIDMRPATHRAHLDFVVFSAHKMYAPFGVGVLAGPRTMFEAGEPFEVGGGTVDLVAASQVAWTALPEREEAGTPCIVGAVALASAIRELGEIGWEAITEHESSLTAYAIASLARVPGLTVYGPEDGERLGVLTFNLAGLPHGLLAAILSHEWGIGTRNGCFCAHAYIRRLLAVGEETMPLLERQIRSGDWSEVPGAVRVSLGLYNTHSEIDLLTEALHMIAQGRYARGYRLSESHGEYVHPDLVVDYAGYLDC